MKNFTVQWSKDNGKAVSEWPEYLRAVKANSQKEALKKFHKQNQDAGSWMVLDCWEITEYDF